VAQERAFGGCKPGRSFTGQHRGTTTSFTTRAACTATSQTTLRCPGKRGTRCRRARDSCWSGSVVGALPDATHELCAVELEWLLFRGAPALRASAFAGATAPPQRPAAVDSGRRCAAPSQRCRHNRSAQPVGTTVSAQPSAGRPGVCSPVLTQRAHSLPCAGSCGDFSTSSPFRFCRRSPESPGFRRNRFTRTPTFSLGVCHPRRTYEPPHPRP
jgi:hypothetical protein